MFENEKSQTHAFANVAKNTHFILDIMSITAKNFILNRKHSILQPMEKARAVKFVRM
jgi:hypothetical protein